MNKIDFIRLEKLENQFDRGHPGRRLAKSWFEEVWQPSYIYKWVLSTEIMNPLLESMRNTDDGSFQLENVQPKMELWREKRNKSWIETFWSLELDDGNGITDTFFQHPNDPSVPSEIETNQFFRVLLASIPSDVFPWARFFNEIYSPSYDEKYGRSREWMDLVVEYAVDDLICIEGVAQFWRGKLGPQKPEDIRIPTWAANAKYLGHGPRMKPLPEPQFERELTPYEKWEQMFRDIEKNIESNGEYQIPGIDDIDE